MGLEGHLVYGISIKFLMLVDLFLYLCEHPSAEID